MVLPSYHMVKTFGEKTQTWCGRKNTKASYLRFSYESESKINYCYICLRSLRNSIDKRLNEHEERVAQRLTKDNL